ncbi:MAG TPA: MFS transporter, partial [Candidatus Limnocylindria bacterium]
GTNLGRTYLMVLRGYRLETILGALVFFCLSWPWLGFLTWVPTYLNVELGQGQALSSTYVTVWTLGATLGYTGYGFVADRWGRRFTMPIVTILAGAMFATLGLVRDPTVLLVYGFFLVMLILGPYGAGLGYVQEIFPTEVRATGWAIVTGVGGVLGSFAPLVGGMTPTIAMAFPVYALPLLLVAPLYLFVFKEMIGKELVDAVDEPASEAGGTPS